MRGTKDLNESMVDSAELRNARGGWVADVRAWETKTMK